MSIDRGYTLLTDASFEAEFHRIVVLDFVRLSRIYWGDYIHFMQFYGFVHQYHKEWVFQLDEFIEINNIDKHQTILHLEM